MDAQADLHLCWSHMAYAFFLMTRLLYDNLVAKQMKAIGLFIPSLHVFVFEIIVEKVARGIIYKDIQ